MAKTGETGVRETVAKMGSTLHEKMGGTGFKETVAKLGGAHSGKNGLRSSWQKWVKLFLETPLQKWVELTVAKMGGVLMAKMGGVYHGKNGLNWF